MLMTGHVHANETGHVYVNEGHVCVNEGLTCALIGTGTAGKGSGFNVRTDPAACGAVPGRGPALCRVP